MKYCITLMVSISHGIQYSNVIYGIFWIDWRRIHKWCMCEKNAFRYNCVKKKWLKYDWKCFIFNWNVRKCSGNSVFVHTFFWGGGRYFSLHWKLKRSTSYLSKLVFSSYFSYFFSFFAQQNPRNQMVVLLEKANAQIHNHSNYCHNKCVFFTSNTIWTFVFFFKTHHFKKKWHTKIHRQNDFLSSFDIWLCTTTTTKKMSNLWNNWPPNQLIWHVMCTTRTHMSTQLSNVITASLCKWLKWSFWTTNIQMCANVFNCLFLCQVFFFEYFFLFSAYRTVLSH